MLKWRFPLIAAPAVSMIPPLPPWSERQDCATKFVDKLDRPCRAGSCGFLEKDTMEYKHHWCWRYSPIFHGATHIPLLEHLYPVNGLKKVERKGKTFLLEYTYHANRESRAFSVFSFSHQGLNEANWYLEEGPFSATNSCAFFVDVFKNIYT